jgi:hypothetical protein
MAKNQKQTPAADSTRYGVFSVDTYQDAAGEEQSSWTRVGVAFPHRDGKGFNVELRALPIDGKLVLRKHEPKADNQD